ncbi:putative ADP-ribosylation factor-like protein 5C isoform X3 [Prionailurus viverrinus]|nr:putative ADP-ribosylation factor-like protein 5C isoform X3 [Prionailurus viverrinus]XP_047701714.1 putative ADP-ribosylation factor-like protein 5C isoform X3 [Prionailurus viverrinus]XP_047701715.1 putative ADP-ribosylation factor-like protein 5C isoform X3 [Prionailurus viverrinus]
MNEVVHTSPTIGSNVEEIVLQKTHFLMWDIGGQEALRSTWNTYYSNTEGLHPGGAETGPGAQWADTFIRGKAHGSQFPSAGQFIILVIDSTDRDRLLTTREELYRMLAHEALRDASVLIFANKQDMKDSMTTVEISQFLTLSAIKDHPWHIQGCCALTGEGLVAAPPAPPGFGPTNEQLTIRTFSCFSPVRIWLTLSSWAESVKHPPTAEMLWVSSEQDRVPALRLILKGDRPSQHKHFRYTEVL